MFLSRRLPQPPAARHARRFLPAAVLTLVALSAGPAAAETLNGTLETVENGGRSVTIAGTAVAVSGSRTNICIAGVCDRDRTMLKTGMTCQADVMTRDGRPEARRLSCR